MGGLESAVTPRTCIQRILRVAGLTVITPPIESRSGVCPLMENNWATGQRVKSPQVLFAEGSELAKSPPITTRTFSSMVRILHGPPIFSTVSRLSLPTAMTRDRRISSGETCIV